MSLRLNRYIKDLRKEAHRFECTDINNKVSKSFLGKNQRRIICIISSVTIFLFLKKGFNPDFVAYASTAISILIGLFTTAIIFILDKYQPISVQNPTSREKLWDTQAYNYTKQFAYITGYNIVLCVFVLVLLSFSALFVDFFNVDIWTYKFCTNINLTSASTALMIFVIVIQRFLILYWLASIVYNTLYAISSMVKYIIVKIERQ
jgi:hypothetical protein